MKRNQVKGQSKNLYQTIEVNKTLFWQETALLMID